MTSLVSIRLNNNVFHELKAVNLLNNEIEKKDSKRKLQQASLRVRDKSMRLNAEFSEVECDPEA